MRYMGSKNKLSKELAPIIQSYITEDTKGYFEPFVGGANMIDKIAHHNKTGSDIHEELIELLKYVQIPENIKNIPTKILFDEYCDVRAYRDKKYPKWYVGLVGFCASYGGRYFDGGYGRNSSEDTDGKYTQTGIRNLIKQAPLLHDIRFYAKDFREMNAEKISGYVVYCDIPYRNAKNYSTFKFPYDDFYKWCKELSHENTVLISEYSMPDGFECVWEKEVSTGIDSKRYFEKRNLSRIEKLFKYKGEQIK